MSPQAAGAISVVLGWIVLAAALRLRVPGRGIAVQDWVLSAAIAILLMAACGLVLLRFGLLLPPGIALACCMLAVAVLTLLNASGRPASSQPHPRPDRYVTLALIVLTGLLFLPFPTYFLNGARDHGVNLIQALLAADTGGLDATRPEMVAVLKTFGDGVRLGVPGFYNLVQQGLSHDVTQVVPQFRQFSPVLIALGSWIGGLEGAVRANGVISVLAVTLFYLVARRYLNVWWSAAGATALLFNASVLWVGRATFSEPVALLIQVTLLALLHRLIDRPSIGLAALAGLIGGLATLNRWDGAVTCFVVAGFAGYVLLHRPQLLTCCRVLVSVYAGVSVAGYLDGMTFSVGQYRDLGLLVHLQIMALCAVWIAVILAGEATGLLERLRRNAHDLTDRLILLAGLVTLAWAVIKASIGFFWPDTFDNRVLLEMAWYLGPLMLLFLLYPFVARSHSAAREGFSFLIYFSGTVYFVLFTFDSQIAPDHFWASRRWVPQVFPHITLVAIVALSIVFERTVTRQRLLAGLGATAVLVAHFWPALALSRSFNTVSLMKGFPEQIEAIARRLSEFRASPVVLAEPGIGHVLAAPLTHLYGIPTILLSDEGVERARSGAYDGQMVIGNFRIRSLDGAGASAEVVRVCGAYTVPTVASPPPGYLGSYCRIGRIGYLDQRRQVLAVGRRYGLATSGAALNTLGLGWGAIEDWGVWLQDETGVLEFRLPVGTVGPCRLRLSGDLYVNERRPTFTVTVRNGRSGRTIAEFVAQEPVREFDWSIDVRADDIEGGKVLVHLIVDPLVSPRQIGLSTDTRQLSVGLRAITLEACGEVS